MRGGFTLEAGGTVVAPPAPRSTVLLRDKLQGCRLPLLALWPLAVKPYKHILARTATGPVLC